MDNVQAAEQLGISEQAILPGGGAVLLMAVLLAVVFDVLFHGWHLGASVFIFFVFYYPILILNVNKGNDNSFSGWLWTGPIVFLAATFLIYTNDFFNFFNSLAILILLMIQYADLHPAVQMKWYEHGFPGEVLRVAADVLGRLGTVFHIIGSFLKRRSMKGRPHLRYVLWGVVISIPLLFVVISLLSSADMVFAELADNVLNIFPDFGSIEGMGRAVVIIIFSIFFTALLATIRYSEAKGKADGDAKIHARRLTCNPYLGATVLAILNMVYLVFVTIQFSYLFAGGQLPHGMNYAEYARQGFFQLCLVALINFIILLIALRTKQGEDIPLRRLSRVLQTVLIVFTGVLLFSAHLRMNMYENMYGYTYLRLLVHAFMLYLSVVFVLGLAYVWKPCLNFFRWFILVTLLAYLGVNYLGIDRLIAAWNVDRYFACGKIDMDYLDELSYEAVPEIARLLEAKDPVIVYQASVQLKALYPYMRDESKYWQSYNISRQRGIKIITREKEAIAAGIARIRDFTPGKWKDSPQLRFWLCRQLNNKFISNGTGKEDVLQLLGPGENISGVKQYMDTNYTLYKDYVVYRINAGTSSTTDELYPVELDYLERDNGELAVMIIYFDKKSKVAGYDYAQMF